MFQSPAFSVSPSGLIDPVGPIFNVPFLKTHLMNHIWKTPRCIFLKAQTSRLAIDNF